MKKYDVYVCDICGKEHYLASECRACEKSHIISYEHYSNEHLIKMIEDLRRRANNYTIGSNVMGMHINSFEDFMSEVAKRLKKVEE